MPENPNQLNPSQILYVPKGWLFIYDLDEASPKAYDLFHKSLQEIEQAVKFQKMVEDLRSNQTANIQKQQQLELYQYEKYINPPSNAIMFKYRGHFTKEELMSQINDVADKCNVTINKAILTIACDSKIP